MAMFLKSATGDSIDNSCDVPLCCCWELRRPPCDVQQKLPQSQTAQILSCCIITRQVSSGSRRVPLQLCTVYTLELWYRPVSFHPLYSSYKSWSLEFNHHYRVQTRPNNKDINVKYHTIYCWRSIVNTHNAVPCHMTVGTNGSTFQHLFLRYLRSQWMRHQVPF